MSWIFIYQYKVNFDNPAESNMSLGYAFNSILKPFFEINSCQYVLILIEFFFLYIIRNKYFITWPLSLFFAFFYLFTSIDTAAIELYICKKIQLANYHVFIRFSSVTDGRMQ